MSERTIELSKILSETGEWYYSSMPITDPDWNRWADRIKHLHVCRETTKETYRYVDDDAAVYIIHRVFIQAKTTTINKRESRKLKLLHILEQIDNSSRAKLLTPQEIKSIITSMANGEF